MDANTTDAAVKAYNTLQAGHAIMALYIGLTVGAFVGLWAGFKAGLYAEDRYDIRQRFNYRRNRGRRK